MCLNFAGQMGLGSNYFSRICMISISFELSIYLYINLSKETTFRQTNLTNVGTSFKICSTCCFARNIFCLEVRLVPFYQLMLTKTWRSCENFYRAPDALGSFLFFFYCQHPRTLPVCRVMSVSHQTPTFFTGV